MDTRQAVAAGLAAACAVILAGCSDDEPPSPTPLATSASATPSPTPDPASLALLTAYEAYWKARVQAQAEPTKSLPKELTRYGTGTAVSDVRATVLLFRQQGIAMRGQPALAPKVTDIGTSSATITDCVDSTKWKPVFTATGKSALAPGQAPRVVMTATATNSGDGWLIKTATVDRDRTC